MNEWRMVPTTATEEMQRAGWLAQPAGPVCDWDMKSIYEFMVAAAPPPPNDWRPIDTAPKDGTIFDAWLGTADDSDVRFYCTPGTRRSPAWHWRSGKFRPASGFGAAEIPTFIQPTHWQPIPPPPEAAIAPRQQNPTTD